MKYVKLIALIMAALLCTAALADLSGMVDVSTVLNDIKHDHTHGTVVRPAPDDEEQPEAEKSTVYYTADGSTFATSADTIGGYPATLYFTRANCECGTSVYFVPGDWADPSTCACPNCDTQLTFETVCYELNNCSDSWKTTEPCEEEHHLYVCSTCGCKYVSHHTSDMQDPDFPMTTCLHCGNGVSTDDSVNDDMGADENVEGPFYQKEGYSADDPNGYTTDISESRKSSGEYYYYWHNCMNCGSTYYYDDDVALEFDCLHCGMVCG